MLKGRLQGLVQNLISLKLQRYSINVAGQIALHFFIEGHTKSSLKLSPKKTSTLIRFEDLIGLDLGNCWFHNRRC